MNPASPGGPRLAILGPGALGLSLARWAAEQGLEVALAGRTPERTRQALQTLERRWAASVNREAGEEAAFRTALSRIHPEPSWAAAAEGAGFLLEALPEDLAQKAAAWQLLDTALPPSTLRLTATSSLPLARIRREAAMEGPLLGFHLFIPVRRHPIVELVSEPGLPEGPRARALDLAARLGLQVAEVRDQPGFAASRMALAQGLEAMRLLEAGVASARELDALMVQGYGHPCGPLELSDRIGLDLRLAIAEGLHAGTGDPRFEPPAILRAKVARGETGRKAGQGFHAWTAEGARA